LIPIFREGKVVKHGKANSFTIGVRGDKNFIMRGRRRIMKIVGRTIPNFAELEAIYERLKKKPNTVGFFIGKKQKAGRMTNRLSIVCVVKEKVREKDLRPSERIPKKISWRKQTKIPAMIHTDVLMSKGFKLQQDQAVYGPGDWIIRTNQGKASVGMALSHPRFGRVLTTAAHLFPAGFVGEKVDIESGNQKIEGKVELIDSAYDYALVRPMSSAANLANLFRDVYSLGGVYSVQQSDVAQNRNMEVLAASGKRKVICRGIHGSFDHDSGIIRDVILTSSGTNDGDSGACLVNEDYSICGLVIGADYRYSYYMPATYVLFHERANLI
jgi:hypothetical protein